MKPLEGLLVLDFSTLLPGPMATLLLAEAGAEVIKIERPGQGDEMRSYTPKVGDDSINFMLLNRGKKSIAVDLKDPASRGALDPLIQRADILVEQFRPGVMSRLGLDYETLRKQNPKLIYCSITGYGQTGPAKDEAGHDLNYQARTGLLALSSGKGDIPTVPAALIADIAGGAYPAMINILLALEARRANGQGCRLDIAMAENLFPFTYWALADGHGAEWPGNGDALTTGGSPRYRLYPTSDGRIVAAAPLEDRFWREFCEIIALGEPFRDDKVDPNATATQVASLIAGRKGEEWEQAFAGRDCCCNVVKTLHEALGDPHFGARGIFGEPTGGEPPALPLPIDRHFRLSQKPASAPTLGQHTNEVLTPSD